MTVQEAPLSKTQQTKGRMVLLLLVLFFVAPLLVVIYMYKANFHPKGESHGDLVQPAVALQLPASFQVNTQDKMLETTTLWHDKWSVVVVADTCEQACQTRLHDVRQIHASLEKDMNRLQRILVTHQADTSELQKQYPDLIVLNQPSADVDALAKQFDLKETSALSAEQVYLVDPLGNLMMSYDKKVLPVEMRKDWVRLLKYSWAG
jgi:cytochrome oxidase Cu insertion factor (SCO1/SenC/PrrC family)